LLPKLGAMLVAMSLTECSEVEPDIWVHSLGRSLNGLRRLAIVAVWLISRILTNKFAVLTRSRACLVGGQSPAYLRIDLLGALSYSRSGYSCEEGSEIKCEVSPFYTLQVRPWPSYYGTPQTDIVGCKSVGSPETPSWQESIS
jgi:hypothetical protein